ncbi:hypothetical protein ASE00_12890 [Sphingomonas sp. Root710]|uniref:GntR family transcriptional regulator n=1 Tax=Sphingomonas sp. Root710 TaxID=1736594 RepID=UPI0006F89B74|nr:GntR family transcriptional regulator [Sphingomonas sp. Root710]KRB82893.1 hypothetical protein ASE00_12890 [Sphingomonas sp. Root710]
MTGHADDVRRLVVTAIRSGAASPGAPLRIAPLAERLRISPIPVRETLSRLAGEGLLAERPGAGYFVPRLHAHQLTEIYRLRLLLVSAAVTSPVGPAASVPARRAPIGPWHAIDPLLASLVNAAGDGALAAIWAYSDHRLLPYRRCEAAPDMAEHAALRALLAAIDADATAQIRRIAGQHIRRRIQRCEQIVRCAAGDNIL